MADFLIGRGSRVLIGRQGSDAAIEIVPETVTAAAAAAAAATSITIDALGTGVSIPAGAFLQFKTPATGARKLVQLSAAAVAGDTSLTVYAIGADDAIADNDEALWPPILGQRTNSSVGGQGNRVTSFPYEQDGYEDGFNATISNQCSLSGNYAIKDAGYSYARYCFQNNEEVRLIIEFPKETPASTQVFSVRGRFSFTNVPIELPSDNIITSNIEGSFNGKITEGYVTPLAYA